MRRKSVLWSTVLYGFGAMLAALSAFGATVYAQTSVAAPQVVDKAREMASWSALGPVEIQANVSTAAPVKGNGGKKEKGTYTLDWAAPDRFRREIHLTDYDEVSVANGTTLYRKRSTDYTPIAILQIKELMNPGRLIAEFRPNDAGPPTQPSAHKNRLCFYQGDAFPHTLCVDANRGWLTDFSGDTIGFDDTAIYSDYKAIGTGFIPFKRQYLFNGVPEAEADVKHVEQVHNFPAGTFDPPAGGEKLDWCADEVPAQRLPLKAPLSVTEDDFQNPEVMEAFVPADARVSQMQVIGSGGPAEDAAMQKLSNLVHFIPATCGGKPVASEASFVINAMDVAVAEEPGLQDVPNAGAKGYTQPRCAHCPDPQYSQAAFDGKIQGIVILNVVIGVDGRAHNIVLLKRLGYGLDERAINTARDVWRFKPALGPDGKPAAVRMLVEINFHLY